MSTWHHMISVTHIGKRGSGFTKLCLWADFEECLNWIVKKVRWWYLVLCPTLLTCGIVLFTRPKLLLREQRWLHTLVFSDTWWPHVQVPGQCRRSKLRGELREVVKSKQEGTRGNDTQQSRTGRDQPALWSWARPHRTLDNDSVSQHATESCTQTAVCSNVLFYIASHNLCVFLLFSNKR